MQGLWHLRRCYVVDICKQHRTTEELTEESSKTAQVIEDSRKGVLTCLENQMHFLSSQHKRTVTTIHTLTWKHLCYRMNRGLLLAKPQSQTCFLYVITLYLRGKESLCFALKCRFLIIVLTTIIIISQGVVRV